MKKYIYGALLSMLCACSSEKVAGGSAELPNADKYSFVEMDDAEKEYFEEAADSFLCFRKDGPEDEFLYNFVSRVGSCEVRNLSDGEYKEVLQIETHGQGYSDKSMQLVKKDKNWFVVDRIREFESGGSLDTTSGYLEEFGKDCETRHGQFHEQEHACILKLDVIDTAAVWNAYRKQYVDGCRSFQESYEAGMDTLVGVYGFSLGDLKVCFVGSPADVFPHKRLEFIEVPGLNNYWLDYHNAGIGRGELQFSVSVNFLYTENEEFVNDVKNPELVYLGVSVYETMELFEDHCQRDSLFFQEKCEGIGGEMVSEGDCSVARATETFAKSEDFFMNYECAGVVPVAKAEKILNNLAQEFAGVCREELKRFNMEDYPEGIMLDSLNSFNFAEYLTK